MSKNWNRWFKAFGGTNSIYEKLFEDNKVYFFFYDLKNEGYCFCLAEDIIKENYNVTFESEWLDTGSGVVI